MENGNYVNDVDNRAQFDPAQRAADQAAVQARQDRLMRDAAANNLNPAVDPSVYVDKLRPGGFGGPDDNPDNTPLPTPPAAQNALELPAVEPVMVTQALGSHELAGQQLAGTPETPAAQPLQRTA